MGININKFREKVAINGVRLLLLTFLYFALSSLFLKSFGFLPQYGITSFFIAFFLIGLGFIPLGWKSEGFVNWLLFISLMLTSIGGGMAFTLVFVFRFPLSGYLIEVGVLMFATGLIIMAPAGYFSNKTKS